MLPLILAGLAVSRIADAQAEGRKEALRKAMRAYQLNQAHLGQAATEQLIAQQTPEARATELATLTADRAKSLRDTVASVQTSNPTQIAGKLSPDYQRSQEAAANTVAERTRRAIEQLSTMGAPGEQSLQQGIRFGRAAGTVDASNSAIGRVGNAFMGDINNTVPNPGMKLLGSGMMAYGAGGMGAGGAMAAAPEQLSGPGMDAPTSTSSRVRRAFSLWGRKAN